MNRNPSRSRHGTREPGRAGAAIGAGGLPGAARRGAGPGRHSRGGDRQGEGAAGRRPGGDLRRPLDARRPPRAALAGAPAEWGAESPAHGEGDVSVAGAKRRPGCHRGERRRRGAFAAGLPGRELLRAAAGEGAGARGSRSRAPARGARSLGGGRSRRTGERRHRRGHPDRDRWRLRRPAGHAAGTWDAARRGGRLRPHVGRRGARRGRADRQLRLPLRRRTGRPLRRPPRPDLGCASRPLAASLRDRARPRSRNRLRLAGGERRPLRFRAALQLGGLALRLHRGTAALLGGRQLGRGGRERGRRRSRRRLRFPPSSRRGSGR